MVTSTKIKKSEIQPGLAKSYVVGDIKIVICNIGNEYYAIEDICSHDDGELVLGESKLTETCQIECPRHGARFDVKTGEAKRMPAIAPIRTHNVRVLNDELEIEITE